MTTLLKGKGILSCIIRKREKEWERERENTRQSGGREQQTELNLILFILFIFTVVAFVLCSRFYYPLGISVLFHFCFAISPL